MQRTRRQLAIDLAILGGLLLLCLVVSQCGCACLHNSNVVDYQHPAAWYPDGGVWR